MKRWTIWRKDIHLHPNPDPRNITNSSTTETTTETSAPLEEVNIAVNDNVNHNHNTNETKDQIRAVEIQRLSRYISALSNLSIQYNFGVIAPSLLFLDPGDVYDPPSGPAYPVPPRLMESIESWLKSVVFIGAIVGQCSMGVVGDRIGSSRALIVASIFEFIGSLGCTVLPPTFGWYAYRNQTQNVEDSMTFMYVLLIVFRAILGIGIGGKYPLASAISAEATDISNLYTSPTNAASSSATRSKEIGNAYVFQAPGAMLPYLIAFLLVSIFGEESIGREKLALTNFQYFLLNFIGLVPSCAIATLALRHSNQISKLSPIKESSEGELNGKSKDALSFSVACRDSYNRRNLLGCGVCWFLYDIALYGTSLNLPELLSSIFNSESSSKSLVSNIWHDLIVSSLAIPGVLVGLCSLNRIGIRKLQIYGFIVICVTSSLLAASSAYGVDDILLLVLSCLLIFSLNWGCSFSTYILPMEVFAPTVRTTFHGFSAGIGKFGGFIGGLLFSFLGEVNISLTFGICSLTSLLGVWMTHSFISTTKCRKSCSRPASIGDGHVIL